MSVDLCFFQYFHYLNDTGTNLYKQELFIMAIRAPTGRTFPENFTIIPSSKKWVFHAIFRQAFLSLYDKFICSLNRLVVTDEEDAEYRSFECLIATQIFFNFQELCYVPSMLFGNLLSVIYICCCRPKNMHSETYWTDWSWTEVGWVPNIH